MNNVRLAAPGELSDNDRLMAMLSYITGIAAIIVLVSEQNKSRPFQRFHAVNALLLIVGSIVFWIVLGIVLTIIAIVPFIGWIIGLVSACLFPLLLLAEVGLVIWYAVMSYQGKWFDIPLLSKFGRGQGWLTP